MSVGEYIRWGQGASPELSTDNQFEEAVHSREDNDQRSTYVGVTSRCLWCIIFCQHSETGCQATDGWLRANYSQHTQHAGPDTSRMILHDCAIVVYSNQTRSKGHSDHDDSHERL